MMSEAFAADCGVSTLPEVRQLLRGAERLVTQYGDKADLVAAQLADACFTAGDESAGHRWAKIFLILATSHAPNLGQPEITAGLN